MYTQWAPTWTHTCTHTWTHTWTVWFHLWLWASYLTSLFAGIQVYTNSDTRGIYEILHIVLLPGINRTRLMKTKKLICFITEPKSSRFPVQQWRPAKVSRKMSSLPYLLRLTVCQGEGNLINSYTFEMKSQVKKSQWLSQVCLYTPSSVPSNRMTCIRFKAWETPSGQFLRRTT